MIFHSNVDVAEALPHGRPRPPVDGQQVPSLVGALGNTVEHGSRICSRLREVGTWSFAKLCWLPRLSQALGIVGWACSNV